MRNLWPSDLDKNLQRSPSDILAIQAGFLSEMTNDHVRAEVNLKTTDEDTFITTFELEVPSLNFYKYELFIIEHSMIFYPVVIFLEKEIALELKKHKKLLNKISSYDDPYFNYLYSISCESEQLFIETLELILSSSHTQTLIKALIAQSKSTTRPYSDDIPF